MTLLKWNKGNQFTSPFNGFLDDFINDDFSVGNTKNNQPSVNVKENHDNYVLEVAAPGFDKADFNIDVDKNLLTISGDKESETEEESKGYTRKEFSYASFERTFTLPETVNVDDIAGKYENGILSIVLPKKVEAKEPKKSIKVS